MSSFQENVSTASTAPLAGLLVIDLGQYIAGPGATMALADLGATVIKVEPITGDQARQVGRYGQAMMRAYNRGKRSIALDLKTESGREVAWRLIARCDVVVQNLRPGALEKLGLGPSQVRERHPRVIYLSISGFGSGGPSSDRPGYDIAAQAESGLMSVTGEADGPPLKVGVPIVDAAAADLGAQAVLAALYGRERSGMGETLEVSLLETALHLQAATWCEYLSGGQEPTRIGNGQPNNAPAAEVVATRDGHIVLSAYVDAHWKRFCEALDREELVHDPRFSNNEKRVAHRTELRQVLDECLSAYTSDAAIKMLSQHQIVAGAVRPYRDVMTNADVIATGIFVDSPSNDGGGYQALGLPYRMGSGSRPTPCAAPECGADSAEVLAELGYSAHDIATMRDSGVVA